MAAGKEPTGIVQLSYLPATGHAIALEPGTLASKTARLPQDWDRLLNRLPTVTGSPPTVRENDFPFPARSTMWDLVPSSYDQHQLPQYPDRRQPVRCNFIASRERLPYAVPHPMALCPPDQNPSITYSRSALPKSFDNFKASQAQTIVWTMISILLLFRIRIPAFGHSPQWACYRV
jgi:hypothetical protein